MGIIYRNNKQITPAEVVTIKDDFNGYATRLLYYTFNNTLPATNTLFKYSEDIVVTIPYAATSGNYENIYLGNSRAIDEVDLEHSCFKIKKVPTLGTSKNNLRIGWITVNSETGQITFHPVGTYIINTLNKTYTVTLFKNTPILDGGLLVFEAIVSDVVKYFPCLFYVAEQLLNYIRLSGGGDVTTESVTSDTEIYITITRPGSPTVDSFEKASETEVGHIYRNLLLVPGGFRQNYIESYPGAFYWWS